MTDDYTPEQFFRLARLANQRHNDAAGFGEPQIIDARVPLAPYPRSIADEAWLHEAAKRDVRDAIADKASEKAEVIFDTRRLVYTARAYVMTEAELLALVRGAYRAGADGLRIVPVLSAKAWRQA